MKRKLIVLLLLSLVFLAVVLERKPLPRVIKVEPLKSAEPQTPTEIKNYIIQEAKSAHVNLTQVEWIAKHESQWGKRVVGDLNNGVSLGVWQINLARNENVSRQCAESVICSTRLSFAWLKKGEASKWSSWRFRCLWFRDENPPDCPAG